MTDANSTGPGPGICLLTPANISPDFLTGALALALELSAVEVVILTRATQAAAPGRLLQDLRAMTERHGKVFLVEDTIELASKLEAEGVLVADADKIGAVREMMGREAMVGVNCGLSRHAAMEAGEAGADFVGLGDNRPDLENADDLAAHISWWSALFEVPSVALGAADVCQAGQYLEAGADFLGLGDPIWASGDMARVIEALTPGETSP